VIDVAHDGHHGGRVFSVSSASTSAAVSISTSLSLTRWMLWPNSDQQFGGVLVDGLVDGDHHAHLEQRLDQIRRLFGHAVARSCTVIASGDHVAHLLFALVLLAGIMRAAFLLAGASAPRANARAPSSSLARDGQLARLAAVDRVLVARLRLLRRRPLGGATGVKRRGAGVGVAAGAFADGAGAACSSATAGAAGAAAGVSTGGAARPRVRAAAPAPRPRALRGLAVRLGAATLFATARWRSSRSRRLAASRRRDGLPRPRSRRPPARLARCGGRGWGGAGGATGEGAAQRVPERARRPGRPQAHRHAHQLAPLDLDHHLIGATMAEGLLDLPASTEV
jgi:hypothetical protein